MRAEAPPNMDRPRLFALASAIELARLERNHRRSPERVQADQTDRLRRALVDARHVPFWRKHLGPLRVEDEGVDLTHLPTIDKAALRDVPERDRLYGPIPPGSRSLETSGTSGVPLEVHYAPRAAWWQGVLRLRSSLHHGIRPWSRNAGSAFSTDTRGTPGIAGAVRRAKSVGLPLDADVDELAERVLQAQPASIGGHPHMVIELGEALCGRYTPKAVMTHGETLDLESRTTIRRLFGRDPVDGYGTAECGAVAWQCLAADLYHVNHEAVVIEVVDDRDRPVARGEVGHLLLTSLWNPLMPFVRYRIGDSASWATRACRCGSRLPALTELSGRTFSWIVDAQGRRVAPQRMWASLHLGQAYVDGIERYRVRQDRTRAVLVEVEANARFTSREATRWAESYRTLLGDVPVEIRVVDRLEMPAAEKFEIISSEAVAST